MGRWWTNFGYNLHAILAQLASDDHNVFSARLSPIELYPGPTAFTQTVYPQTIFLRINVARGFLYHLAQVFFILISKFL